MRTASFGAGLLVLAAVAEAVPARRALRFGDIFAVREVAEPALSPDGGWVAYTISTRRADSDLVESDLWTVPRAGGPALQLTRHPGSSDWRPRYSPDGRWLAFLSDRTEPATQIWLLDRRGGEPWQLTSYAGGVSELAWSPDSSRLVVVAKDPDPAPRRDSSQPLEKEPPRPIVVNRLQFKLDGVGFLSDRRDHLYLFDLRAKSSVQLTSGPWDDSQPVFSPDGQRVAFTSNRTAEADGNYDSDIWTVAALPGASPRRISRERVADSAPAWSPDGRWLAWIEGGDPAELWYAPTHLAVAAVEPADAAASVARAQPRALTLELDRSVYAPLFAADSSSVLFFYEDHGNQPLGAVSLTGGVVEEIVSGDRFVSAFEVGPQGELVVLESNPQRPAELSLVEAGELRQLTETNAAFLAGIRLAPVERFTATTADGTTVEGFYFRPPEAQTGEPQPALLRLHGGPVDQSSTEFNLERQMLAAYGYLVIAPNPRGSSGRGRDFAHAIWADWGNKDFDDVMAAVDHAVAAGVADPERLGVYGWSYGGILTNYVITKSQRFKAAISGASEVNYFANYGHDQYVREWEGELGLPWRESARWQALSPYFQVEQITTPTLVVCGQDDWNVPLLNSEQLYQALRRLGRTTELVIYPGEDHSIDRPSFVADRLQRYVGWFDRYLLGHDTPAGDATRPEATSLLGQPLLPPPVAAASRKALESDLEAALDAFARAPASADAAIWLGRRLGYLGRYRDAIDLFTRALELHPDDVRLLRHRGHRYLTVRELDRAVADLAAAGRIVREKGLADELEPDGAPNEYAVPTSTTQFNIWYHLGLAHYLRGEFDLALEAYRACLATAKGSNDRLVAATDWLWLTLMRLDRRDEAAAALTGVASDLELYEDQVYLDRIRLYKGELTPEQMLMREGGAVDVATRTYGVAAWYLVRGETERARALFEQTLGTPQWGAFAVLAAEAELARMR